MPISSEEANRILDNVNRVVDAIKPHLAGHPSEVQCVALADLLSIWLAGHSPKSRESLLATHIQNVRELITVNEMIMFGPDGHPDSSNGVTRQ
ncbi:hypothetical protein CN193_14215 [Sinorhizobium meliloti]|uniref:hypothetical protein n=1 Tax=Rhizobium meliloti TaxID=382 RepID=UPI000FD9AF84|nr:hypothetical protein [Sinorhizobium meliloti]RVJ02417.1 hypothetical protein CN193_14215 [Sinorhizobium meliloti]